MQIDYRWAAADADRFRRYAMELVALAPDVILASTSPAVAPLQQATRTVPIVFVIGIDPVGAGFVASLARPSGKPLSSNQSAKDSGHSTPTQMCKDSVRHLELFGLKLSAQGEIALLMAGPVAMALLAVAWRIARR